MAAHDEAGGDPCWRWAQLRRYWRCSRDRNRKAQPPSLEARRQQIAFQQRPGRSKIDGFGPRQSARRSGLARTGRAAMNDRKSIDATDYVVGYGRPPRATQFAAGKSGNPRGRPKGSRTVGAILQDILSQKIAV